MRINNNLMAMNTHRQLGINSGNGAKSIEKLSSGFRINRAGDDAAGLSISEKMRSQIRGLGQASRNAQDGISLIQTAEGALNETHDILQRMRELAVQSSTDTNTDDDRKEIQNEISELKTEIDRIATTTEFNTQKLLDGSKGAATTSADLTGGVETDISATNKLSVIDGKETKNNVVDIRITGATATDTFGTGSAGVTTLRLELDEKNYDNIVDFTNELNKQLDAEIDKIVAASGMTAANATKIKNIEFDFDVSSAGKIKMSVVDTGGAIASGAKFEVEQSTMNATVASAMGLGGADLVLTSTSGTAGGTSGATKEMADNVVIAGASAQWDAFELKIEDGVDETANQNNELKMTYDELSVTSYVKEGEYSSGGAVSTELKNAIVGVDTTNDHFVSAIARPGATNWTDLVTAAKAHGSGTLNLTDDALTTGTDEEVTGVIGAVDDLTVAELEAKGYKGAENDMKASYFKDIIGSGTDQLAVSVSAETNKVEIGAPAKMEIDENSDVAKATGLTDVNTDLKNSGVTYQIGANAGQTMVVDLNDMQTAAIGKVTIESQDYKLEDVDVSTKEGAQQAIEILDQSIKDVSSERSKLGAVQNRLEHTIKNLDTSAENLQASESRIRDVDMAKEMMTFTKNNILQQAAQAMLAQANQAPQGVLQLLR